MVMRSLGWGEGWGEDSQKKQKQGNSNIHYIGFVHMRAPPKSSVNVKITFREQYLLLKHTPYVNEFAINMISIQTHKSHTNGIKLSCLQHTNTMCIETYHI